MEKNERTYLIQTYGIDFKVHVSHAKDLKEKWDDATHIALNLSEERLRVMLNIMWTFGIIDYNGYLRMRQAVYDISRSAI